MELFYRAFDFDRELLSSRLQSVIAEAAPLSRALTNISVSDDTPSPLVLTPAGSSLYSTLVTYLQSVFPPANLQAGINDLIAPEIRLGRKLDINRFIGNGIDDDGNGVIDEPSEVSSESESFNVHPSSGQTIEVNYSGLAPNYSFGQSVTGRQLLARHLYILAMYVTKDVSFPTISSVDPAQYKAYRLAQWAVNVIDYCDPDSIMTRFPYDPTPLDSNGWTPTKTVFGAESPELLFSEGFALHDVRVSDSSLDVTDKRRKTGAGSANQNDRDTDQLRIPQGSVFLEIFCPRAPIDFTNTADLSSKGNVPAELYDGIGTNNPQLNLGKIAPSPGGTVPGVPVWRVAFSEPHYGAGIGFGVSGRDASDPLAVRATRADSTAFDIGDVDKLDSGVGSLNAQRFIWFTNFATPGDIQNAITGNGIVDMSSERVFFAPQTLNSGYSVSPGQYVAIAPRTVTHLGSHGIIGALPDRPSNQRFEVVGGTGVVHSNQADVRQTPALGSGNSFMPALPLVIGTFKPTGWRMASFRMNMLA